MKFEVGNMKTEIKSIFSNMPSVLTLTAFFVEEGVEEGGSLEREALIRAFKVSISAGYILYRFK